MNYTKTLVNYWKKIEAETALQALDMKEPSIAKIRKETREVAISINKEADESSIDTTLTFAITDLVRTFNVSKPMTTEQIQGVVEIIKKSYYFLRLGELKYCFNKAKRGLYSTTYDKDKMDSTVIFAWLELYLKERDEVIEQQRQSEHAQIKRNVQITENIIETKNEKGEIIKKVQVVTTPNNTILSVLSNERKPKGERIIDKAIKAIEDRNAPKEIKKRELSPAEKLIQSFYNEYDALIKEQSGNKSVTYKGAMLSQDEYINTRSLETESPKVAQQNLQKLSQQWLQEFDHLHQQQYPNGSTKQHRTIKYKDVEYNSAEFLEIKLQESQNSKHQ